MSQRVTSEKRRIDWAAQGALFCMGCKGSQVQILSPRPLNLKGFSSPTTAASFRAVLLSVLFVAALSARAEPVAPSLDITAVRVEIVWARTNAEIDAARKRYDADVRDRHRKVPQTPEGFSVLVRRGDEMVCRLFVLQPERVDDERTLALGHELAHCLLGAYHR